MKTNARFRELIVAAFVFAHAVAFAQTKITYDVTALIDVADVLMVRGSEIQWHHPGSGAAIGRHSGRNEATTISSTLDGVANLNEFAWLPIWPEVPPAQIRYEAFSSVLSGVTPTLPAGSMAVAVTVLGGRGSVSIEQLPAVTNDWILMVRFADGFSGSAFLSARISVELVALQLLALDANTIQARWPTNATAFQLESAPTLPALPGDWSTVTNEPVVVGDEFVVTIDSPGPQGYFRLRRSGL